MTTDIADGDAQASILERDVIELIPAGGLGGGISSFRKWIARRLRVLHTHTTYAVCTPFPPSEVDPSRPPVRERPHRHVANPARQTHAHAPYPPPRPVGVSPLAPPAGTRWRLDFYRYEYCYTPAVVVKNVSIPLPTHGQDPTPRPG